MSSILDVIATALTGLIIGFAFAVAGIWPLISMLRAARRAARHDETTGLPNRRAFYPRLDRAARRGRVAVALLDLNGFKAINDTCGHQAGDQVLTRVAARLAALPSPAMFAARLSGDEFALLIDDRDGGAMLTAQAAWRTIAAAPVLLTDGQQVDVTASVGVAVSRIGADPRVLLHEADLAMYAAKRDDGRVRLYTPDAGDTPGAVATRPAVRPRDRRHPGPAPLYPPAHSGRRRRP